MPVVVGHSDLAVVGQILPDPPFVEVTERGQVLNFDIVLTNRGNRPVELERLEITFVGAKGVALARRLDLNGTVPALDSVPSRRIAPGQRRLLFNPVECAPPKPPVVAVRVAATLTDGDVATFLSLGAAVRQGGPELFMLPLRGRVWVWDGHDYLSHHRRWDYTQSWVRDQGYDSNAMRYAYDLVLLDSEGRHRLGDGDRNEDYVGYGARVRAPAAGRIIEVADHRPDDGSWDAAESRADWNALLGNRIVIDHGDQTFSHLAHIRRRSATVTVGQHVGAGDVVATVGNSGSSMFPHLHYQRVDAATMHGEGVPTAFTDLTLDRGTPLLPTNGHIDSGDVVYTR